MKRLLLVGVLGLAVAAFAQAQETPDNSASLGATVRYVDFDRLNQAFKESPRGKALTAKYEAERLAAKGNTVKQGAITRRMFLEAEPLILAAVQEAGEAEGAPIVVDQPAVFYGGQDLTDAAIRRLTAEDKVTPRPVPPSPIGYVDLGEIYAKLKTTARGKKLEIDRKNAGGDSEKQLQLETEFVREMRGKVRQVVDIVARTRKAPMIFERQAVVYGGQDYTPEVLQILD